MLGSANVEYLFISNSFINMCFVHYSLSVKLFGLWLELGND